MPEYTSEKVHRGYKIQFTTQDVVPEDKILNDVQIVGVFRNLQIKFVTAVENDVQLSLAKRFSILREYAVKTGWTGVQEFNLRRLAEHWIVNNLHMDLLTDSEDEGTDSDSVQSMDSGDMQLEPVYLSPKTKDENATRESQ